MEIYGFPLHGVELQEDSIAELWGGGGGVGGDALKLHEWYIVDYEEPN